MILLSEINSVSQRFKVPAETIEKDYVIGWILKCLAKSAAKKDFIFYGGTAIKKIYFEDHRFSEDIDLLSDMNFSSNELVNNLIHLFKFAKEKINLSLGINPNKVIQSQDRIEIFAHYSGYEEIIGSPKEVRLDIAMGTQVFGEIKEEKILKTYSDMKPDSSYLKVHSLNTILANKLGLLMDISRKEPRDIFDIWFLLNRTRRFDFSKSKVKKSFEEKYGFVPNWKLLIHYLHGARYRERWAIRLEKQMAELPPLELVLFEIEDKLKSKLRA